MIKQFMTDLFVIVLFGNAILFTTALTVWACVLIFKRLEEGDSNGKDE